ncbi:MAG: hypothetical protein AVDCRST_MAG32-1435, partial [uncultured Nocardioides sp.]
DDSQVDPRDRRRSVGPDGDDDRHGVLGQAGAGHPRRHRRRREERQGRREVL